MDFLRTLLTPTPARAFCLDIGANEGGYTHLIRHHRPEALVHGFEPIPAMYAQYAARYADDPRVVPWPFAVSDREYDDTLAVHEAWTLAKLGEARRGRNAVSLVRDGIGEFPVSFVTVDKHLERREPQRPVNFIKIDTDGYEDRVLRGAACTLLADRPLVLIEIGYLIEDVGDDSSRFIERVYRDLGYVWITQDGDVWTEAGARARYPHHTTCDVAMVPQEQVGGLALLD